MPVHKVLLKKDYNPKMAHKLWTTFIQPSVVKPHNLGSSVGVSIVRSLPEMKEALEKVFALSEKAIIEEYIKGREATAGVLEDFRGEEIYPLFPIEIVPQTQVFYDYESKYDAAKTAKHICPGNFSARENEDIKQMSILAHKAINAKHYSRSDFIVHPKRGVYLLEINTLPGLTATSLIPDEMRAIGSSYSELLDHVIKLALRK
jgi:D-alanine-D-alanine ligase